MQVCGEDGVGREEMRAVMIVSARVRVIEGDLAGSAYGVGGVVSVADEDDSARRWEASLMRLSRSFSLGMTCLATMIFSNSFCRAGGFIHQLLRCKPHPLLPFSTSPQAPKIHHKNPQKIAIGGETHLTLLPQFVHHLPLHLLQHALGLPGHGGIAAGKVLPRKLPQRALEALRVQLLQTRRAGARRDGRVSRGQRRGGGRIGGGLFVLVCVVVGGGWLLCRGLGDRGAFAVRLGRHWGCGCAAMVAVRGDDGGDGGDDDLWWCKVV